MTTALTMAEVPKLGGHDFLVRVKVPHLLNGREGEKSSAVSRIKPQWGNVGQFYYLSGVSAGLLEAWK